MTENPQPKGFNVYWEEVENENPLLHLVYTHTHPGGEDHHIVIGHSDAAKLRNFLGTPKEKTMNDGNLFSTLLRAVELLLNDPQPSNHAARLADLATVATHLKETS